MDASVSARGLTYILSWDTKGIDWRTLEEQYDVVVSCAGRVDWHSTDVKMLHMANAALGGVNYRWSRQVHHFHHQDWLRLRIPC